MDSSQKEQNIDAVVDYLLRDQDFLLSKEIRHRVEELNQLLVQAHNQQMKVEFSVTDTPLESGGKVTHLDAAVYKRI
ncbi:MAG: hypothetical protein HKN37_11795 [Rhodothermales bacterium]|jgi:hypothetical protein|nr:hypothetical protein [Rhodothermales bacterium]